MTAEVTLDGGCLCGELRYRLNGPPRIISHCHCTLCRRVSGAPFVTWLTVNRDRTTVTGQPAWYQSSSWGRRGFCAKCGTHVIACSSHYERYFDIPAGTLDDPELIRPDRHVFADHAVGWINIDDGLPAHRGDASSPVLDAARRRRHTKT